MERFAWDTDIINGAGIPRRRLSLRKCSMVQFGVVAACEERTSWPLGVLIHTAEPASMNLLIHVNGSGRLNKTLAYTVDRWSISDHDFRQLKVLVQYICGMSIPTTSGEVDTAASPAPPFRSISAKSTI